MDQRKDLGIASCCRELTSSLAITILDSLACTVFEHTFKQSTRRALFASLALPCKRKTTWCNGVWLDGLVLFTSLPSERE